MEKILVSACLLGEKVKYHGGHALCDHETLMRWKKEGRLVATCPEVSAGFSTPRPPAEITSGDGADVWNQNSKVIEISGTDVTDGYKKGAQIALELALKNKIKIAILKEDSPSCGSQQIYDGKFKGIKKTGKGVTTVLLEAKSIKVFSENNIKEAEEFLARLEQHKV